MRIVVIGTGYVGLVTGTCLAHLGHQVTCLDKDAGKIAALGQGRIPIYEPGLAALVQAQIAASRLAFAQEAPEAVAAADAVFLAVGTPMRAQDGAADLSAVYAALQELVPQLAGYTVIVNKSTVPVGTAREMAQQIHQQRAGVDVDVCSNPEFLREGSALADFLHPDRIVIGANGTRASAVLEAIYQPLQQQGVPLLATTRESAELIKYASNAFLAMKITFINEMADLCEKVDANVQEVATGMGLDSRIGSKFLQPGPGYGGSCFPKDTGALAHIAQQAGAPLRLVETTAALNAARRLAMVGRIRAATGGRLAGQVIAVLGATFKPETDDLRESPAMDIIAGLLDEGAIVRAHDPVAMAEAARQLPDVRWCRNAYECCAGADAVVLATEWQVFKTLDLVRLQRLMASPVLIDLRNVFAPEQAAAAGFVYHSLGRPLATPAPAPAGDMPLSTIYAPDVYGGENILSFNWRRVGSILSP